MQHSRELFALFLMLFSRIKKPQVLFGGWGGQGHIFIDEEFFDEEFLETPKKWVSIFSSICIENSIRKSPPSALECCIGQLLTQNMTRVIEFFE